MPPGELEGKLLGLKPEEVTNYILSEMDVDPTAGRLTIFGSRVFMARPELFVNLQKQLERTVGLSSKGIVYLAGERTGFDATEFVSRLSLTSDVRADADAAFRRMAEAWSILGVGRITFTRFTRAPLAMDYTIENSVIADAYGRSAKPVCHLFAGWGAGLLKALFREEVLGEEIRCKAKGDQACDFEVRLLPSR